VYTTTTYLEEQFIHLCPELGREEIGCSLYEGYIPEEGIYYGNIAIRIRMKYKKK
jgi:hypothetical protein